MNLSASVAVEDMHEGCDFGNPAQSPGHSTQSNILLSDVVDDDVQSNDDIAAVDSDVQSSDNAVAPKGQEPSSFTRIMDPPNVSALQRARMSRRTTVFQAPPSSSSSDSNEYFEVVTKGNKEPEDNQGHEIVPNACSARPGSAIELCRLADDAK